MLGALLLIVATAAPSADPTACPELVTRLRAPRMATPDDLRKVLDLISAEYPNEMGQFIPKLPPPAPPRAKGQPPPPPPKELDWQEALTSAMVPPELELARYEVLEIVKTLRALAATSRYDKECPAAKALLDFAFEELAGLFRDEVGRQVRSMGPSALPPLIRIAMGRDKAPRGQRRYANYQLDRMDRQRPDTVMAQVHADKIRAEILLAYGETRPQTAVHAVLGECDAVSPRVRRAARSAWMEYVRQPPPDPPKRKLKLTGGKQTEEEKELYLTYRDLADLEIRRQWPALMNEPADPAKTLLALSEQLFAKQDAEREKRWDALFEEAEQKRRNGDVAGAVGIYGWILAQDPFYGRRHAMVAGLRELSQSLHAQRRFGEASGWLRQARALASPLQRAEIERELARALAHSEIALGGSDPTPLQRAIAAGVEDAEIRGGLFRVRLRRTLGQIERALPATLALLALSLACALLWRRTKARATD